MIPKSILLNINSTKKQEDNNSVLAGLNKSLVHRMKTSEYTRFLGIWIGNKNSKKNTIYRIQLEINRITSSLISKKATDKQALYVFNRVLIPKIKYCTQNCYISYAKCDKLTRKFQKILKNKAQICSTVSNSAIHYKGIYGLKSIREIQTESQITGLIHRLNNSETAAN